MLFSKPYNHQEMQLGLSSSAQIPDGLMAAMALLSQKPHQGVPSRKPALHPGINERNSTVAIGLRAGEQWNRVGSRSTGKERDTESGNDYFEARYYGSSTGRFMSPDDGSDQTPFNPQSWNLYSYGRNNPLIGRDDDGHTYNVCPPGVASGSSQCTNIDDKTFEAEQKQDQANGVSFAHGTISDSSGVQGTYTHDPDIAGDPAANIAAMGNIGNQGMGAINWFAKQMVINAATDGLVGAAGAALEASPLATQIGRNALKGGAGEAAAKVILRMRGYKIVGEQVSVMTSAGRRVVDFVVEKGGETLAIEVKTGNAARSTSQLAKDAAMESEGGRVGASGGALAGQTLKVRTIEMRPF